ncbi:hypothetical protein BH11PSE10_BH11PSE10_20750 [soil metagenome]
MGLSARKALNKRSASDSIRPMSKPPQRMIDALAQAWARHEPISSAGFSIADEAEAYAVHDGLVARLGWQPIGQPQFWKSGGASRQALLTHAPLAVAGVRAGLALDFSDLQLHAAGVEAEIALRTKLDLHAADLIGLTVDNAAAAVIDTMAVSIELIGSRWQEALDAPALLRLADCQSHGGLALGDWLPYRQLDWATQACTLTVNGRPAPLGSGAHPLGDPAWGLLPWLRHATREGRSLPAGSVLTTGAWRVQLGLKPGDLATAQFDGLGAVTVQI